MWILRYKLDSRQGCSTVMTFALQGCSRVKFSVQ